MRIRKILPGVLIVVAVLLLLSVSNVLAGPLEDIACNGNFDGDLDVDAIDVAEFLVHFGRNQFIDRCSTTLAPVPQTGLKTDTSPCPQYSGDDLTTKAGLVLPTPRFRTFDGKDEHLQVVIDYLTGLEWSRNCDPADRSWYDALYLCNSSVYGEHDDWRLPNIRELMSLFDWDYYAPAISNIAGTGQWTDNDAFNCGTYGQYFWSSTRYIKTDECDKAYYVNTHGGTLGVQVVGVTMNYYCVRGPQIPCPYLP